MQEEEKNNGMEGMSVEEMFLGVQESYQEAQLRAQEENRAFARTEFFRMDKFGTYRLRILPIAPNPDARRHVRAMSIPSTSCFWSWRNPLRGTSPRRCMSLSPALPMPDIALIPSRLTAAWPSKPQKRTGTTNWRKDCRGSFGGGLKYSYGHCLYVFDLGERAKGVQMMTLSHAQFKDLDERKFKLWSKKLAKNPSYPCPISSVYDAYPVEIESARTEPRPSMSFPLTTNRNRYR